MSVSAVSFFQRTPLNKVLYMKSLGNHTVLTAGRVVGSRGYRVWQSDTAIHDDRYVAYCTGNMDQQMQYVTVLDWKTGRSVSLRQAVDKANKRRHMLVIRQELIDQAIKILTEF